MCAYTFRAAVLCDYPWGQMSKFDRGKSQSHWTQTACFTLRQVKFRLQTSFIFILSNVLLYTLSCFYVCRMLIPYFYIIFMGRSLGNVTEVYIVKPCRFGYVLTFRLIVLAAYYDELFGWLLLKAFLDMVFFLLNSLYTIIILGVGRTRFIKSKISVFMAW